MSENGKRRQLSYQVKNPPLVSDEECIKNPPKCVELYEQDIRKDKKIKERPLSLRQPSVRKTRVPRTTKRVNPDDLPPIQEGGTKYESYTVEQLKKKIQSNPIAKQYLAESKVARPRKALLIQSLNYSDTNLQSVDLKRLRL